jgi:hypothetical protein
VNEEALAHWGLLLQIKKKSEIRASILDTPFISAAVKG